MGRGALVTDRSNSFPLSPSVDRNLEAAPITLGKVPRVHRTTCFHSSTIVASTPASVIALDINGVAIVISIVRGSPLLTSSKHDDAIKVSLTSIHSEELLTFGTITDIIKFAQNKNCKRRRHSHEKVYFCPSAPADTDPSEWPCVRYTDLCDLRPDCPGMEDEHPTFCMFHQLRNAEMNGIRQTIAELAMIRLEEITGTLVVGGNEINDMPDD
uniref:Late endosomal/lysosomal adaptor and MAPK and MTOR activator 5 n=1 Tax=Ascaris lumbricoides TaxID=6252 RepID=A0A0M3HMR7_ASCLU